MALLNILTYPDRRLLQGRAAEVKQVDERIRQLVRDMGETMYSGAGYRPWLPRKSMYTSASSQPDRYFRNA